MRPTPMKYDPLDAILNDRGPRPVLYDALMPRRISRILLVSSLYDSYMFVEDGRINDIIFGEYLDLNQRYAPRVERVSTARRALEHLRSEDYDLVIATLHISDMGIAELGAKIVERYPDLPVMLLVFDKQELREVEKQSPLPGIDQTFLWSGDVRLFLAMVKYIEDALNVWHDTRLAGVRVIVLVEDSVRFYSTYLPLLYTEIMQHNQALMSEGLNQMQKLLRQHARPKVLLATSYEQGLEYYHRYKGLVLGIILDAAFPRGGERDSHAGIDFARLVKEEQPDIPVMIQSSDGANASFASRIGASFIHKRSPRLAQELRQFMQDYLGFGDFVFRRPDGSVVTSAKDLRTLIEALRLVPEESLLYHGRRKHFSTWLMARTEFGLAKVIREKKMAEFKDLEGFRQHLISSLSAHRYRKQAGIVADFAPGTLDVQGGFSRIGTGSLGGKGRGLAFFSSVIEDYHLADYCDGVRIGVPPSAILATNVFSQFMSTPGLLELVHSDPSDDAIDTAFVAARLPQPVLEQLRLLLGRIRYPLAVRSSSLLEDATSQPFAGIYSTYMLPNNHDSLDRRVLELV
ncbi:MAG: histidine kinase, partial [Myxococcota bacterium]|nr:histidine kinase [Myxococcota bacterium]